MEQLRDAVCDLVSIAEEHLERKHFEELDNAGVEIINCLEELEKYRKDEKDGVLLHLPCPIGAEVWKIITQRDNFSDQSYKIVSRTKFRLDMLDEFGITVFLDQDLANSILKNEKIPSQKVPTKPNEVYIVPTEATSWNLADEYLIKDNQSNKILHRVKQAKLKIVIEDMDYKVIDGEKYL